jgi:hypothetical protein
MTASYLALWFGVFYFVYAVKYYASSLIDHGIFNMDLMKTEEGHPAHQILAQRSLDYEGERPYVSVHLPFFNELNVARRRRCSRCWQLSLPWLWSSGCPVTPSLLDWNRDSHRGGHASGVNPVLPRENKPQNGLFPKELHTKV